MPIASRILLLVVAVLNLIPGIVALAPAWSTTLYGIDLDQPALALTLRHRAVLLALVGVFFGLAAFHERWWTPALVLGLGSKVSFLMLSLYSGSLSAPLRRVAAADVLALLVVAAAAWLK